jgi:hypothetical protein
MVGWTENVSLFLSQPEQVKAIADAAFRLATWARQLERCDAGNAALCFVRQMQVSGHHVAALLALALYTPAASSMRTTLETALYYTYYRTHPSELSTLVRRPDFYVQKGDIMKYHRIHTVGFTGNQKYFELENGLTQWYSRVSAIVHGQLPGVWEHHARLADTSHNLETLGEAVQVYSDGVELVHALLLCTVGREKWDSFTPTSKTYLLRGLSDDNCVKLGLDRT